MRTPRTFLLVASSLLLSLSATAQTEAPMSPANQDMLSWMLRVLLGAIAIVAVLAGIALTTLAANRRSFQQQAARATAGAATPAAAAPRAPAAVTPAAEASATQAALQPRLMVSEQH